MQHFFAASQPASVLIAILKRTKKKFCGEFFSKFFIFFFFASILKALVAQKKRTSGISSCNNVARKYSFSLEKKINKDKEFAISGFREMCKQLSNIVDEIYVYFAVAAAARRRFTVCGTFDFSEL